MPEWLTPPPRPAARETLPSFLGRLAASKGVTAADFSIDIGASLRRVLEQEPEALERLASWGRISADELAELLSWTGERIGGVRLRFRGEAYVSRALRNPSVRGCPLCLRADGEKAEGGIATTAFMRGDWQFRDVVLCLLHRHPLVELWRADNFSTRSDYSARIPEISTSLLEGKFDRLPIEPTPHDIWLDARLEVCRDVTWLAEVPVNAVTTFCRLLGGRLLELAPTQILASDEKRHAALDRGFSVVSKGIEAIRETLDQLAALATGAQYEPRKAFGDLYTTLSNELVDDPAFEIFRQILRDCILSMWPIGKGEMLLGQIVPNRLLHSVRTASEEIGSSPQLIEQFLTEAGALAADDQRSHNKKTFDAMRYEALVTEIPKLIGPKAMRQAMGATEAEFEALERDGVLIPRTRITSVKSPWRIEDALDLITDLKNRSVPTATEDGEWETIQLASQRSRLRVSDLVDAIRAGLVEVSIREGETGYHAFLMRRSEVDGLRVTIPARHLASIPGKMSAAEFGRSVGMRDMVRFIALVEAGHVSAFRTIHPQTHREQWRMTAADIAGFCKKFATTTTLGTRFGLHHNTVRSVLANSGIQPFSSNGSDFGAIWLRTEIEPIFLKTGHRPVVQRGN